MIPEVALLATTVALCCAIALAGAGFYTGKTQSVDGLNWCKTFAEIQVLLLLAAFVLLAVSFLTHDFSVLYIAENSNINLAWYYRISAIWGAHEGSFLLWTLVMAAWTWALSAKSRQYSLDMSGYTLGILGVLNVGFLLFLLVASNPFERLVPGFETVGADLNVILQDFGLIVHPPLLYMGYVGCSVPFAFALAALMTGEIDAAWARWTRPWLHVAWASLTLGIALGSWWAYYELGWGGWWFWDPVENASFMPWLAATALIHSLSLTERRNSFKTWTVLLAISTFGLCLIGAFLVRSGVLTSVHSFAVDPERGVFLLTIVAVVLISALGLFAVRARNLKNPIAYAGISRELLLVANNTLLVFALATVFVYTLYPLFFEWVTGGERISIGPPYFNGVFVPIMLVLAVGLAISPVVKWKHTPLQLFRSIGVILIGAVVLTLLTGAIVSDLFPIGALLVIGMAVWIIGTQVKAVWNRWGNLSARYLGQIVAHIGFATTVIGIAVTTSYSTERDLRMQVGDVVDVNQRSYELANVQDVVGPNYSGYQGIFDINGIELRPELRNYHTRVMTTTEAAIEPGFFGDLFVALAEPKEDGSWGVRIQDKPFVRWIWLGCILMALGGTVALLKRSEAKVADREATLALA